MPKRAGAPAKAKSAKVAKVVEPAPVSPLDALLDALARHFPADVETLRAALPHAIGSKKEERQSFQGMVIDTFTQLQTQVTAKLSGAVQAAEAEEAEVAAAKAQAAQALEAAVGEEKAKREHKDAAEQALAAAEEAKRGAFVAVNAARAALAEAETALQDKESGIQHAKDIVGDAWVVLREGTIEPKDWRLRDKQIKKVATLLGDAAVSASLLAAVPGALKERPDNRGPFAKLAVQHGAEALATHVDELVAAKDAARASIDAKEAVAITTAAGAAEEASARVEMSQNASIAAQNAWADATTVVFELKPDKLAKRGADAAAGAAAARAELEGFQAARAAYEASAAPPPADDGAAAAPAAAPAGGTPVKSPAARAAPADASPAPAAPADAAPADAAPAPVRAAEGEADADALE